MLNLQQPYNQFSEHDEKTLQRIVDNVTTGFLCEIGCWTGHSTSILAQKAKDIGTKLIVIDSFEGNEGTPLIEFSKDNDVKSIFINNMKELDLWDSIILFHMKSDEAFKFLDDKSLSFLFIDAGHTYSDVLSDLKKYSGKLSDNAVLCGHDYESSSYDERFINEDYADGKHHGVIKAVNEFLGTVSFEGRMWWRE